MHKYAAFNPFHGRNNHPLIRINCVSMFTRPNIPYLSNRQFVIRERTDTAIGIIDNVLNPKGAAAVWAGWMWIRLLMLKWQDKGTVTSQWCEQGCVVQLTIDDTFMLVSDSGRIPTAVLIDRGWNGELAGNYIDWQIRTGIVSNFPSFAFKALIHRQLFRQLHSAFTCEVPFQWRIQWEPCTESPVSLLILSIWLWALEALK